MLVYKLLKGIQTYYPVGLPHYNELFEGYSLVQSVISQKHEQLTKRQPVGPWRLLIQDFKKVYPRLKRQNFDFHQVPSLSLALTSKELMEVSLQQRSSVVAVVSLLLPYYTVYIVEELSGPVTSKDLPISFFRSFERPASTDLERSIIDTLKHCLSVHYPAYSDLDYQVVQQKLIGAIPVGADPESGSIKYPMFDFLYGRLFRLRA